MIEFKRWVPDFYGEFNWFSENKDHRYYCSKLADLALDLACKFLGGKEQLIAYIKKK